MAASHLPTDRSRSALRTGAEVQPLPGGRAVRRVRVTPALLELEQRVRKEGWRREWALRMRLHLHVFTWRGLRRLVHYVAGAVVVIPLLELALTPLRMQDLKLMAGLAAAFGLLVAATRPRGIAVGFLLATTVLLTLVFTEHVRTLPDALRATLALLCFFGFGLAVGIVENVVRHGE